MADLNISEECRKLANLHIRGELGTGISKIVQNYTQRDLKRMEWNFSESVRGIDASYKKKLEKTIREYLYQTWEKIRLLSQQGGFLPMKDELSKKAAEFWVMTASECEKNCDVNQEVCRIRFLKYLLAGFSIYVLEVPPHPVGMPFPGGDAVSLTDGVYFCPVRDKAGDVDSALCPFCPAKQTPESGYLKPPVKGSEHRKQEYLRNTFDFHHYNG